MQENEQTSQEETEERKEDKDLRELFQAQMERVMTTTKDDFEERERLIKVKLSEEIKGGANRIMANHRLRGYSERKRKRKKIGESGK